MKRSGPSKRYESDVIALYVDSTDPVLIFLYQ